MKKSFSRVNLFFLSAAALLSCKKELPIGKNPVPDQELKVALNAPYLPAGKIDSAIAVWEVAGTAQTIKLKTGGSELTTELANFAQSGSGTLTVQLFTKTTVSNMPLQWEQRFTHTMDKKKPIQLTAPVDLTDAAWSPRVISRGQIWEATATAIIAVRPEDAYFELKDVNPGIAKRIEVVRGFYLNDTASLVASRDWVGGANSLDSKGGLVNREHFESLPIQMNGRPWNKYKIRVSFYAALNPARIYETEFVADRP